VIMFRKRLLGALSIVAMSLVLTGCLGDYFAPEDRSSVPVAGEFDHLTESGVERIKSRGSARLDMISGRLEKEVVGLPADTAYGPTILAKDGRMIEISIAGPDGDVSASSDTLRFNTVSTRPDFSEATYFLRAGSWDELVKFIHDGVARYGIDADAAGRWIESIGGKDTETSNYALGPGTSTGLAVTYDLRYDGPKGQRVIIVHVNPVQDLKD